MRIPAARLPILLLLLLTVVHRSRAQGGQSDGDGHFHGIPVCVTGASGYIASVLVGQLRDRGYTVVGTTRSPAKYAHQEAFRDVELLPADLASSTSFDEAFSRCRGGVVFHTASPFIRKVDNPQEDLVDPAVHGTLNVLRAAKRAMIQRVILTSSCAAITAGSAKTDHPDKIWSEEDWQLDNTLEHGPYRLSKVRQGRGAGRERGSERRGVSLPPCVYVVTLTAAVCVCVCVVTCGHR